ncbi:hypothetical protein BH09VER1_BH09VER1_19160 [soil metagenome]
MAREIAKFILVGLTLLGTAEAQSESVAYTSKYEPRLLPSETEGTKANPVWYFQTHEGGISNTSHGVLSASTMHCPESDRLQFWQIGLDGEKEYGNPVESWTAATAEGVTIDFTIKVTDSHSDDIATSGVPGGFELLAASNGHAINIYFDTKGITAWGARITMDDSHQNTEFKTYRLVIQDGKASLFEAGSNAAIFSELTMRPTAEGYSAINFGTGTTTTSGAWELSFLGWNTKVAQLAPPPKMKIPQK